MSSTFGNNFKISIFGESHGKAVGVTINGIPAGIKVDMAQLQSFLDRRKPGTSKSVTPRKEDDIPDFLSGFMNNITTGTPITAVIYNNDKKSRDYLHIAESPRPGHADYPAHIKYCGFEDYRGGGHFSGRLTAPLCVAGGIAKQILSKYGIEIKSKIVEIHGNKENPYEEIEIAMKKGDSVGGIIQCEITGLPVGLGEPMFDGLENKISQVVFGIPAVKGIEFGIGFDATKIYGSENNDEYTISRGNIVTKSNNHGGILGGLSTGMPLIFNVGFKPTPSIFMEQNTVEYSTLKRTKLKLEGRHDPCIVPRALPCVEAAGAIAVLDLYINLL